MNCRTLQIINQLGLHARASAKFVKLASEFTSDITLAKNGQRVNGKSIMGIMMLAAGRGVVLELCADGEDEAQALDALAALVDDGFGEDD